jgi:sugar fermentation stimulation protein A
MGSNCQKRKQGKSLKTPSKSVQLFRNDLEAVFVSRPNRFLIIAQAGKKRIPCHCPNPGRMEELLAPGAKLILEKRVTPKGTEKAAKTEYTAAGLYYRDGIVPLVSVRANMAAEALVLSKIIPGIQEIHAEFTMGNSRFDFLCVDKQGTRHLVEVKACSLVEYGAAMFPDAPSVRALKHLEELAASVKQTTAAQQTTLGENGYVCHVLFVIVHGGPKVFIPNLHTDPDFSAALSRYAQMGMVQIHAALIRCEKEGSAALVKHSIPVILSHGGLAARNSGCYLLVLEIAAQAETEVGSLGTIAFKAGWYVYAGSAMKNLNQRVSRHLRKIRKAKHWHIDYVTPFAKSISAFPIRSYRNLECELAAALQNLGGKGVPRFGCTDCRECASHLYYFKTNPINSRNFVEMLLRFRHVESFSDPEIAVSARQRTSQTIAPHGD